MVEILKYLLFTCLLINIIKSEEEDVLFKNVHYGEIHEKVIIIRKQKEFMALPDDCRFDMCQETSAITEVGGRNYNWTWPRTAGGYRVSVKCPNSVNIGTPPFESLQYGNRTCQMNNLSIIWNDREDLSDCPVESAFERARKHYRKEDFQADFESLRAIDTLDKLCSIFAEVGMNGNEMLALCSLYKDLSDYNSWVHFADAREKYLKIFDSFSTGFNDRPNKADSSLGLEIQETGLIDETTKIDSLLRLFESVIKFVKSIAKLEEDITVKANKTMIIHKTSENKLKSSDRRIAVILSNLFEKNQIKETANCSLTTAIFASPVFYNKTLAKMHIPETIPAIFVRKGDECSSEITSIRLEYRIFIKKNDKAFLTKCSAVEIKKNRATRSRSHSCFTGKMIWRKEGGYYEHICDCKLMNKEGSYFALEITDFDAKLLRPTDIPGTDHRSGSLSSIFRFPYSNGLYYFELVTRVISIVCLLATLATFALFKKLRKSTPAKILICLCVSLLLLSTVMFVSEGLVGVGFGVGCLIANILRIYAVLASLLWNGAEGINMYLMLVQVFDVHVRYYVLKAGIVSFGLPVLIIGILKGFAKISPVGEWRDCVFYCTLSKTTLYFGLFLPMAIIIVINLIIYIKVAKVLREHAKLRKTKSSETRSERKEKIMRFLGDIAMLFLLGIPWVFSAFGSIDSTGRPDLEFMEGIFNIFYILLLNLQGLFIFIFHCLRVPEVRSSWTSLFSSTSSAGRDTRLSKISLSRLKHKRQSEDKIPKL